MNQRSQSGFLGSRVLLILPFCAAASSIVAGTLLAFLHPDVPAKASQRTLTFQERVAYQRGIEEVYWRHRIWPKERANPKPSLDAVMPKEQLERIVADYLSSSRTVEDYYHHSITAKQLQAEMDRMAQHTKQPEVLRELFEALGNDPFVIAECLARPILSERLTPATVEWRKASLDSWRAEAENQMPKLRTANVNYTLPAISGAPNGCTDDMWTATSTTGAPSARTNHTAVWTGSEMIIWGGWNGSRLNTGGRYNPSTDSWIATSTINAASGRELHTAIWTGSEMIVWGGDDNSGYLNTGGRYNPVADAWTSTTTINTPTARNGHSAVWTGSEMIVWGGLYCDVTCNSLSTGGRYNPSTDSWAATTTNNAPEARNGHTAVWTGSEMIVWGGNFGLNTGGRYNPSTDSWTATDTINAPGPRGGHTAVWTDSEMIVWGGRTGCCTYHNTGGRYNPSTDSWTATSIINAPAPGFYTAVWASSQMIVWGGLSASAYLNTGGTYPVPFDTSQPLPTPTATATVTASPTPLFGTGGRYDPGTDSWRSTSTINAPTARVAPAVWTGSEMIVWGGAAPFATNTGGRYCAQSGALSPTPTATATATPTATPTQTARPTPLPRLRPTPAPRP